ncbi:MAG: LA_3696 family protein, partial [bacterium]
MDKPLREKSGDEAADSLVELVNQSQSEQKKDILEFVEE